MKKLIHKTDGIFNFSDYKQLKFKILYGLFYLFLLVAVIISAFPLVWLFFSSFKEPSEIFTTNFKLFPETFNLTRITEIWTNLNIGKYYLNSIIVVAGSVVSAVIFNGILAYVVSVIRPKGYKFINLMIIVTMLIPSVLNMVSLLPNIASLGLMKSYIPIWLSYGANAYFYIIFKVYFDRLPRELFDAAQIDGCNKIQMFGKVVVPISLPIVSVVSIFTVNASWSDFLLPYLVLNSDQNKQTLMVRIYSLSKNPPAGMTQDKMLLLILLAIIPVIIIFSIFQKKITSNVATTGIK